MIKAPGVVSLWQHALHECAVWQSSPGWAFLSVVSVKKQNGRSKNVIGSVLHHRRNQFPLVNAERHVDYPSVSGFETSSCGAQETYLGFLYFFTQVVIRGRPSARPGLVASCSCRRSLSTSGRSACVAHNATSSCAAGSWVNGQKKLWRPVVAKCDFYYRSQGCSDLRATCRYSPNRVVDDELQACHVSRSPQGVANPGESGLPLED